MLIVGAHRINHGGFDGGICQQIRDSRSLRGYGAYGYGAYAYYADRVPVKFRSDPFVIFQPLATRSALEITHVRIPGLSASNYQVGDTFFFVVRGVVGSTIPIAVLGFINCPGFPQYEGRLYYS